MNPVFLQRLLPGLDGTSDVLDSLLENVGIDSPIWDFRPDPERFTLREVVAHLADYNAIWLDRFVRTKATNRAAFERGDPAQLAIANDYAHADPRASLSRFREGRLAIVNLLKTFADEDWALECIMPAPFGPTTLEYQATFLVVHDSYHTAQIAQWLALGQQQHNA
jgi:uncharacterized damage-inducible protein DinB